MRKSSGSGCSIFSGLNPPDFMTDKAARGNFQAQVYRTTNMARMASLRLVSMIALVAVAMSGCSIKMAYNNLDRIARWSVSDYIDMTDAQREYFDQEVDVILYWHRTTQLPEYADYFRHFEVTIGEQAQPEEIEHLFESLYDWGEKIEDRLLPLVVDLILSMNEEQYERLPQKLAKDNEALAEDEAGKSLEEIREEWAKEFGDLFKRFSGRLTAEQKTYLLGQSIRYQPQFQLWAEYRARWQADMLSLLQGGREDEDGFAAAFLDLVADRESYYGDTLTEVFASNEVLARDVTVWMINHLTEEQRERFFTRLEELGDTFAELYQEAEDEAPVSMLCIARCG